MSKPTRIQVLVRLKAGVLDVQGKAIETGLGDMGVKGVSNIGVGKLIEFDVSNKTPAEARELAEDLSRTLLANSVIERFEIKEVA